MHAKYVLGLILVLQVSLSLCQIPPPSQDLVGKYMTLKEKFLSRLENLKLMDKIQKLIEQSGKEQVVKEYVQFMDPNLRLQAAENFVKALGAELEPMVVQARLGLLGAYEEYLRPYIGKALADGIDAAQPVLDAIMPSNKED